MQKSNLNRTSILRRFASDRRGSVFILGAIALPVVIGVAALVAEFGHALLNRAENQRVADLASYAGALSYTKNGSNAQMIAAARSVASLNGISPDDVTVVLTTSPRSPGKEAVSVTISTHKPLVLAPVLGDHLGLQIASLAVTELGSQEEMPGCILALDDGGSGLTLSGGTSVTANQCSVASNATVTVPCGTNITTEQLHYDSVAVPSQPCGGITSPGGGAADIVKAPTPDPFADNEEVAAATGRMATVASMSGPPAPTVLAGTNIDFAWSQASTISQATAVGCSASFASPVWTFTCPGGSQVNLGTMTVGGGISVNFNLGGSAATNYNFSGRINSTGGGTVRFGPGTYNVAQGIFSSGNTNTEFAAGTFRIGRSNVNCSAAGGNAQYSLCNASTLTFAGPSTFELQGGFSNGGGATLRFGQGTQGNSFRIGPSSNGYSLALGGGSNTIMGDTLASGSVFQLAGNVYAMGGGSCLSIGAAAHHDIKGNFAGAGSIIFGAGAYTIDGYFSLGQGGGATWCDGQSVTVHGVDVSLVISGAQTPNSWPCSGLAFCVGAGYNNITLTAPTSGPYANLAVLGPQASNNSAGALFTGGAGGATISGAFYFPNGPISMNGGASASGVPGGCLQLIGSQISLAGGTHATSECIASSSPAGGGKITLVQ